MKTIRLALEYECSGIWLVDDFDTLEPEELPISDQLRRDIKRFNAIFQGSYDRVVPQDSGLSSKEADDLLNAALVKEGRSLFLRLKEEIGDKYIVTTKYE